MFRWLLLFSTLAVVEIIASNFVPIIRLGTNDSFAHPLRPLRPNVSSQDSTLMGPLATRVTYDCDKNNWGQPNFESCKDAYMQMPNGVQNQSYGDRNGDGHFDVQLPQRYVSSL